jgi:hypothetical protein
MFLVLELQHHRDAGEVESGVEQDTDAAQPDQVVSAVAAGAALGPGRFEQAAGFVEAQVLHTGSDQFRGGGDAVDATAAIWLGCGRIAVENVAPSSCGPLGGGDMKSIVHTTDRPAPVVAQRKHQLTDWWRW